MKYSFACYGHENITARHKTTLEFTKEKDLGLEGDCIVGVRADFSLLQLKKFIKTLKGNNKVTIKIIAIKNSNIKKLIKNNNNNNENKINKTMENNDIVEKINAEINPNFNSDKEMVIRKTDFISERTFAVRANKAAFELNMDLIEFLKGKKGKIGVIVEMQKQIDF